MKKLLLFIASFATFSVMVSAQTATWHNEIFNVSTTCRHVEAFGPGDRSVIYVADSDRSLHTFLGTLSGFSAYYKYVLPPLANVHDIILYSVNDMCAVGNTLFFCGNMQVPIGHDISEDGHVAVLYREVGYVSKMMLSDMLDMQSPQVTNDFFQVDGSISLSKLDVRVSDGDTLIGLVGKADEGTSILVTMKGVVGNTGWEYNIISNIPQGEVLTDIVFGEKYLVTASRFTGENLSFGLRYVQINGLFNESNILGYEVLHKFPTDGMTSLCCGNHPTWHDDLTTIRLAAMPYSDDVTVAYEGRNSAVTLCENDIRSAQLVVLFRVDALDVANIRIVDAQSIHYPDVECEDFADIKCLPDSKSLVLLHSHMHSVVGGGVTLFIWDAINHITMPFNDENLMAIDNFGEKLWMVGNLVSSNAARQAYRDFSLVNRHLCFPTSTKMSHALTPLPSSEILVCNLSQTNWTSVGWRFHATFSPVAVLESDSLCR